MGAGLRGDVRVLPRLEWFLDRMVATGTVVLRDIGGGRPGEIKARRFLESPFVSPEGLAQEAAERTAAQCAGRHIVLVQDTTEINFAGRSGKRQGFGPAGNGRDPGYFIHPVIALDRDADAIVGVVDMAIWTRQARRAADRRKRRPAEKESARWLAGCAKAAERLSGAASLTMVADRESDLYPCFAGRPAGLDLIVRAAQDRALAESGLLFAALGPEAALCSRLVEIAASRPGAKPRQARLELRAGPVRLARPKTRLYKHLPESVDLVLVEAIETAPPSGAEPIVWRLLTTHRVQSAADALAVVDLYRRRWRIEQVFRALKSDGLDLEQSQVTTPKRLFNLAACALVAAVRTIQLVDARDGSTRPATDILDEADLPAVEALSRELEGATARQKNPHTQGSLAFLAWVCARLGGWTGYYKPPGPKTMRKGLDKLSQFITAYAIAKREPLP